MHWTRVKDKKQLVLNGISIETDRSDSSLRSVTLTDEAGNKVRVVLESYNLYVEVPKPPEMVEKFSVTGNIAGVPVTETLDSKYDADVRKRELDGYGAEVSVETVTVPDEIPF